MIKSELVQRISTSNPHLYQRDVENIVNAILNEIVGRCRAVTGSNCAASAHFPSRTGRRGPGTTPAPAPTFRSRRSPFLLQDRQGRRERLNKAPA